MSIDPFRIRAQMGPAYRHLLFEGPLTDSGVARALSALWRTADYGAGRCELYDLRGISSIDITAEGMRLVADLYLDLLGDAPNLLSAILAESGLSYGMARVFQAYLGDREANVRVFDDFDAAVAWLTS